MNTPSPVAADAATWRALVQRAGVLARRHARGVVDDPEDVAQEALLRAVRGQRGLRDPALLDAWLGQIVRRVAADAGRQRARHPLPRDAPGPEAPPADLAAGGAAEPTSAGRARAEQDSGAATRLARSLPWLVSMLPPLYGEAVRLTDLEGRRQAEVAAELGVSLACIKGRVRRGRAQLRALVDACCHVEVDARGGVVACRPRDGFTPPCPPPLSRDRARSRAAPPS